VDRKGKRDRTLSGRAHISGLSHSIYYSPLALELPLFSHRLSLSPTNTAAPANKPKPI
jgi:hypothetical protein